MRVVIPVSIALGFGWNILAMKLMGGGIRDAMAPGWLLAGLVAGVAAGAFTIWSRRRRGGDEALLDVLANYYLGIVVYWASFVVIQRVIMIVRHGGWTAFDLRDHLILIVNFLFYGSVLYGIILVPLCFLSRRLLWTLYLRTAVNDNSPAPQRTASW